jgi:protein-S-isoprenylcysteine O-methyltransferase Ste14
MFANLVKSLLHNIGVVIVALGIAYLATFVDSLVDRMIRREERQLERQFGEEWKSYKRRVRRWLSLQCSIAAAPLAHR